jgi:hypothetical protein
MTVDLTNVVPFTGMSKELYDEIARIKKVRSQMTPHSEPYQKMDSILQQTLRRFNNA